MQSQPGCLAELVLQADDAHLALHTSIVSVFVLVRLRSYERACRYFRNDKLTISVSSDRLADACITQGLLVESAVLAAPGELSIYDHSRDTPHP